MSEAAGWRWAGWRAAIPLNFLVFSLAVSLPLTHFLYLNQMSWEGRVDFWLAVIQRDVMHPESELSGMKTDTGFDGGSCQATLRLWSPTQTSSNLSKTT